MTPEDLKPREPRARPGGPARAVAIAGAIIVAAILVFIGVYGLMFPSTNDVCREGYRATIGLRGIFCAQGYVP